MAVKAIKQERSNRLQPKYGHMALSAVDRPLELLEVPTVAPAADLHAIQVDGKHLGELREFLGRTGAAYRAALGKQRGVSRVIFQRLDEEWASALYGKWGDSPYFAMMTIGEFEGTALEGCPLVVEIFCRCSQKDRLANYLWRQVDKTLMGLDIEYVAQVAACNKVRVGLPSVAAEEAFRQSALPRLQTAMRVKMREHSSSSRPLEMTWRRTRPRRQSWTPARGSPDRRQQQ